MKTNLALFVIASLIIATSACSSSSGTVNATQESQVEETNIVLQVPSATPKPSLSPTLEPSKTPHSQTNISLIAEPTEEIVVVVTEEPTETAIATTTEEIVEELIEEFRPLPVQSEPYIHPSGAFTLAVPEGWKPALESETEVAFSNSRSTTLGGMFIETKVVYDEEQMQNFIDGFLSDFMVNFSGYYEVWTQEVQPDDSVYVGLVYNTPDGNGDADFFFNQKEGVIFILYFITPRYVELSPTWREIINSYIVNAEAALATAPVTPTVSAIPTATPKPPETITPEVPSIPEGKGLIIFNNHTGSDFIVEFIGPNNISQTLPPNSVQEFNLDPGHYKLDGHSPGGEHFTKTYEFDIVPGQTLTFSLSGAGMGTTNLSQN